MQREGFNDAAKVNAAQQLEQAMMDHQPPYRFEKQTGLKGIAGKYRYPGGLNAVEFDDAYTWTFHMHGGTQALPTALLAAGITPPEIGQHEDMGDYLRRTPREVQDFYRRTWDELVSLNPELKTVRLDKSDILKVYDAINGAASGFKPQDINYYFEADNSEEARRAHFADPLREKIQNETGAHICWIASPETLSDINLKLEERKARMAAIRRTGPEA